ncbi:MAG TPA: (2Fe-2S)-binding protein [Chloroflexota bacterium]|nr:(2Fe-2S)-binding protein [Chloroflexota bacterium]
MVATQKSTRSVVNTTINGEPTEFIAEPRQSLLECLRDIVGLTGTKEGCNDGNCGACSVMFDGRLVNSCLVLGVEAEGAEITTVEGIATPQGLHPLQTAFLEQAALQCGICTPGFLVAAKALLEKEPNPTEERIRFWLAGNLCRCTGYDKIVRAVMQASQMMQNTPAAANGAATRAKANGKAHANGRAKRNGKA